MKAFHLAIHEINQKFIIDRLLEGLDEKVPPNDPFKALLATCNLISEGVVAILGPSTHQNAHMVQTVCDDKDIPLLDVRWVDYRPSPMINFYPHPNVLTQVYVDILNAWNYEDFVILYENDDSLKRVGELLKFYDSKGHQMLVRQLDKYHNGNYR